MLALEPAHTSAMHGGATVSSWGGDYEAAIRDLTACLEHRFESYDVRFLRGLAFLQTERCADAIADLTRAIALGPGESAAYMRRWQAYVRIGEKGKAAADMQTWNRLTGSDNA